VSDGGADGGVGVCGGGWSVESGGAMVGVSCERAPMSVVSGSMYSCSCSCSCTSIDGYIARLLAMTAFLSCILDQLLQQADVGLSLARPKPALHSFFVLS